MNMQAISNAPSQHHSKLQPRTMITQSHKLNFSKQLSTIVAAQMNTIVAARDSTAPGTAAAVARSIARRPPAAAAGTVGVAAAPRTAGQGVGPRIAVGTAGQQGVGPRRAGAAGLRTAAAGPHRVGGEGEPRIADGEQVHRTAAAAERLRCTAGHMPEAGTAAEAAADTAQPPQGEQVGAGRQRRHIAAGGQEEAGPDAATVAGPGVRGRRWAGPSLGAWRRSPSGGIAYPSRPAASAAQGPAERGQAIYAEGGRQCV